MEFESGTCRPWHSRASASARWEVADFARNPSLGRSGESHVSYLARPIPQTPDRHSCDSPCVHLFLPDIRHSPAGLNVIRPLFPHVPLRFSQDSRPTSTTAVAAATDDFRETAIVAVFVKH